MITVDQSGTTSALTINTETQLGSDATTNGVYACQVDLNNLALGDTLEVRVYTKTLSGGTMRQAWKGTFSGPQTSPIKPSPPLMVDTAYRVTLKQTAGTGRTFDWKIQRS